MCDNLISKCAHSPISTFYNFFQLLFQSAHHPNHIGHSSFIGEYFDMLFDSYHVEPINATYPLE